MTHNVALLRGINVGGKNMIKMVELRACFEKAGFRNVTTYIQSGNVLFEADSPLATLAPQLEAMIAKAFSCKAKVVLRTRKQIQTIIERAPAGFGANPRLYRYDVIFLQPPLTAVTALKSVPAKPGVDQVHAGPGVLYFSRLVSKAPQSHLSRLVSLPMYQSMTIRNWNTTTKLLEMMDSAKE